ncbi:MAG: GNAT family N-acetyltransferase [Pirellulales bacterium]|nr:GNAT family N-acetyltransferase [Pirellulales bacterium]
MIEVVEVNDRETLSHYRLAWNSLFCGTPNASFFNSFDWFDAYWQNAGSDQKMRVLVVQDRGEPIGILPLCIRRETYRVGKVRVLTYPLDNWSTWYGPIGPNPATTMLAAMQHLRRTPRDWDMFELRWVPDEGVQGGKPARAMRIANMFSEKQVYQVTSLVDLPNSFDEFLANKSQAVRRQYRRLYRSLFESGRAEFVRHRPAPASQGDGDPRWDLYDDCETIAQASWQANVTNGNTITHEPVRDFFRETHALAAKLGMADLSLLYVDGRPAAYLYGYHCRGHVSALRTGFDPSTGDGVGAALMFQAIQDSCQRGDRLIDFGPGEREHKRRLRTRTEATYRLTYTPLDSWRSQAVRFSRWVKNHWHSAPQPTTNQASA